jgi:hypothetical protein
MTIWKEHIDTEHADHRAGRFAVLNKIDVLWDDLQGEKHTNDDIERIDEVWSDTRRTLARLRKELEQDEGAPA